MAALPPLQSPIDDKAEIHELEDTTKQPIESAAVDNVLVSKYADLTRSQAIRKFWRLFVIGVAVASAGM